MGVTEAPVKLRLFAFRRQHSSGSHRVLDARKSRILSRGQSDEFLISRTWKEELKPSIELTGELLAIAGWTSVFVSDGNPSLLRKKNNFI